MSSLKVTQINKSFQQPLLQDISFMLAEPGIYGLLGRNGVGKSTLLKIITNRIFPDSGQVMLDGEPLAENSAQLEKIFLMSEVNLYPKSMKVQEAIRWTARFYNGFDQVLATDLLTKFDLAPRQKIAKLSTGYQTIFKLIVALCVPAEFVLLDEPVLGLDANHREIFYHTLIENYTQIARTN
jgi:ABC-2 type transport system ATP-binding protein